MYSLPRYIVQDEPLGQIRWYRSSYIPNLTTKMIITHLVQQTIHSLKILLLHNAAISAKHAQNTNEWLFKFKHNGKNTWNNYFLCMIFTPCLDTALFYAV